MIAALLMVLNASTVALADPGAVATRAFDVMAGPAWERARYIAFTFNVERDGKIAASYPQRLDRFTGEYLVSGKDRENRSFVVIMNVNTRAGKAWLDGAAVANSKELLELGYGRFINDTYWLLMPLKLRDPGVKLESAGERNECDDSWDVVKLSFEQGVGLTPGDQYWVWVNRDTGLVDVWEMLLQGQTNQRKVIFKNYRRFGDLLLSTQREFTEGGTKIRLDDVTVRADVPPDAFKP